MCIPRSRPSHLSPLLTASLCAILSASAARGQPERATFFLELGQPVVVSDEVPPPSIVGKAQPPAGSVGPRTIDGSENDAPGGIAGGPGIPTPLGAMYVGDGAGAALAINIANGDNVVGLHNPGWLGITGLRTSDDGNLIWNPRTFPAGGGTYNNFPFNPWSVPGNAGAVFFGLYEWTDSASSNAHCVVARSTDSGVTWSPFFERLIDVGQDRGMMDIDRTSALGGGGGATHNGKLYLCYDNFGVNFSGYVGSYLQIVSPAGAALTELTISTAGANFRGSQIQPVAGVNDGQAYLMALSTSGSGATRILRFHEVTGGGAALILDKSSISFPSTGQRLGVSERFGVNGHRVNSQMFMDIDRTNGPRRGTLYVISDRNPNPADPTLDQGDVYLSVSANGASSWSSALLPTPEPGKTQYFSMIDVDENGWLHVAYYQNDFGSLNGGVVEASEANLYYTVSFDGGLIWTPPVRVNDPGSTLYLFDPPNNLVASNYYLLGDYQHIQATGTGTNTKAYVLWTGYDRNRSGGAVGDARERVLCTTIMAVCDAPAAAPSGVSASDNSACDRVTVSWSAVAGASRYQVWRHTFNNSAGATLIGTTAGTSFDDTTAVAGTFYFYWVKAASDCASGPFSSPDSGRRAALTISVQPEPTAVPPGGTAFFSIQVSGLFPLTYQWRLGGTPINTIANPSAATATLMIANVSAGNLGAYDCIVSDACRSVTSASATLAFCATGACAGEWIADGDGGGVNSAVTALAVLTNGDAIVGGGFTSAGGGPANRVARFNPATGAWSPLGIGTNGWVRALAVSPAGDVLVGGDFVTAGGVSANRIARYSPGTNVWSALGAGVVWSIAPGSTRVHAVVVIPGGDVIAGGYFDTASGVPVNSIARYRPGTNSWSALGSGVNGFVHALAVLPGGDVIVSGTFTIAGGQSANNIARYNPVANTWSALGTGLVGAFGQPTSAVANALAVDSNGDVMVGGNFETAGGVAAHSIARYHPATNTWSALGSGIGGLNQEVDALTVRAGDEVIAGGYFSLAGGAPAGRIARYNPATTTWSAMCAGVDSFVYTLATLPAGDVLAGGSFSWAGGYAAANFARWTACLRGDVNCDGGIDFFDIDPFLLALFDPAGYAAAYPACDRLTADCNLDGVVDFFDIDPFLACLFGGPCP